MIRAIKRVGLGIVGWTVVLAGRSWSQAKVPAEISKPSHAGGSAILVHMGEGVIWALAFVVIAWMVYALQQMRHHSQDPQEGTQESPLEVLKKRYVRGEISKVEYDRIRRDIESQ